MIYNHLRIKALFVRAKGIEPIRLSAPDPKSGLSTNFNTPAKWKCKCTTIYLICKHPSYKCFCNAILDRLETDSQPDAEAERHIVVARSEVIPQLEAVMISRIRRISIRITGTYPEIRKESLVQN